MLAGRPPRLRAAISNAAVAFAWVFLVLASLAMYIVAGVFWHCGPMLLFRGTMASGVLLGMMRATIDVPPCEDHDCECDEQHMQSHLWARWWFSMIAFVAGNLLLLQGVEPFLTTVELAYGANATGSIADAERMFKFRHPAPVVFFFNDGYVDLNLTIQTQVCTARAVKMPGRPCTSWSPVELAPVFASPSDPARNGSVFAWARNFAWARDTGTAVRASRCGSGPWGQGRPRGLCGVDPRAIITYWDPQDATLVPEVVAQVEREFAILHPEFPASPSLPTLLLSDPAQAARFPTALTLAPVCYGLAAVLTLCTAIIEVLVKRYCDSEDENERRSPRTWQGSQLSQFQGPLPLLWTGAAASAMQSQDLGQSLVQPMEGGVSATTQAARTLWPRPESARNWRGAPWSGWPQPAPELEMPNEAFDADEANEVPEWQILDDDQPDAEGGVAAASGGGTQEGSEPCVICCARPKDTLLAPCGHVTACQRCSQELRRRQAPCPICRRQITAAYRVFNA